MRRVATTTLISLACTAAPAAASPAQQSLSMERARHAVIVTSPNGSYVDHCRRRSAVQVRCTLVDQEVLMPTDAEPEALGVISLLEGPVTVTLKHAHGMSYLRVHTG